MNTEYKHNPPIPYCLHDMVVNKIIIDEDRIKFELTELFRARSIPVCRFLISMKIKTLLKNIFFHGPPYLNTFDLEQFLLISIPFFHMLKSTVELFKSIFTHLMSRTLNISTFFSCKRSFLNLLSHKCCGIYICF